MKPIDCDVHPTVPGIDTLLPYLEAFWRDSVVDRGIEGLDSVSYPPNAPISARPDFRNAANRAATDVAALQAQVFDRWGADFAICNCLYGVQLVFNEDMARAFARAVNDWIAKEWLDRDPRLRASIVVPLQNVEFAVEEIERCARDPRFVQVLVLAMGETPLGRRHFWPVYAAAERHGLPIGIMPAAPIAIPSPRWAGRAIMSRTIARNLRVSSPRSRASSARACSPNIPA